MESDDREAAVATALLSMIDQGFKYPKGENPPSFERVQARNDALGGSPQRSVANLRQGVKVGKAGSRQKLSKTSQAIVVAWLEARADNPNPSKQEKDELAREAGLTVKQVSDFAGNWRKRKWKPSVGLDQMLDDEDGGVVYLPE